jgi:hypothetical protein
MDVYQAPECRVVLEVRAEQPLRLRPACPLGFTSTHNAVRALLERAGEAREVRLHFGRIVEYPWLGALFDRWSIVSVSVEKVLLKPAAELPLAAGAPLPPGSRLPYDALLIVGLRR